LVPVLPSSPKDYILPSGCLERLKGPPWQRDENVWEQEESGERGQPQGFNQAAPRGQVRSSQSAEDSRLLGERDTRRPGAAAFGTQRSALGKGHQGLEVREKEARSTTTTADTGTVPSRSGRRPMEVASGGTSV